MIINNLNVFIIDRNHLTAHCMLKQALWPTATALEKLSKHNAKMQIEDQPQN